MRKDEVTKIDKRTLDAVLTELANRREECDNLRNRLLVETRNNKELQKKVGYLEALFDKAYHPYTVSTLREWLRYRRLVNGSQ